MWTGCFLPPRGESIWSNARGTWSVFQDSILNFLKIWAEKWQNMWKRGESGQLFKKNFSNFFINHCTYALICPSGYISVPIRPTRTESGQVSRFAPQREKFNSSVFCLKRGNFWKIVHSNFFSALYTKTTNDCHKMEWITTKEQFYNWYRL